MDPEGKSSASSEEKISKSRPISEKMRERNYQKHEDSERDKGPNIPRPFDVQEIISGNTSQNGQRGPALPQPRYDPIGYPETGREPGPNIYRSPQVRHDPLNFGEGTGFTDDPTTLSRPWEAAPDHLTGPDGVRDQLRDFQINARIQMGDMPQHRGMPSPPVAPMNDIRGEPLPRNFGRGGGNLGRGGAAGGAPFFYHQ